MNFVWSFGTFFFSVKKILMLKLATPNNVYETNNKFIENFG